MHKQVVRLEVAVDQGRLAAVQKGHPLGNVHGHLQARRSGELEGLVVQHLYRSKKKKEKKEEKKKIHL